MADGRTVKLDGVCTFYYTAVASGNGVDSPDKVTAKQITGVRVRFIPETSRSSNNQVTTRSLVDSNIFWEESHKLMFFTSSLPHPDRTNTR